MKKSWLRAVAALPVLALAFTGIGTQQAVAAPTLYLPFTAGSSYQVTQYPHLNQGPYNDGAMDLGLPYGTPVLASAPGRVVSAGQSSVAIEGIAVIVDIGNNVCLQYIHLSGVDVTAGQQISQAQQVARSGNTGGVPAHLHWNTVNCSSRTGLGSLNVAEYPGGLRTGQMVTSQNRSGFTVRGAVRERYNADGGAAYYGQATSNEIGIRDNGVYQTFERGTIYWKASTGAFGLRGGIKTEYEANRSENGFLGYPTSREITGLKNGGAYQVFEGGTIYWTPAQKAFAVRGAIRATYQDFRNENGFLGYPTSSQIDGLKNGGAYQVFEGGTIYQTPGNPAYAVRGGIKTAYEANRSENGFLGYPISNEITGLKNGGAYQVFEGGTIYWTPAQEAYVVRGGIRTTYQDFRNENGVLGYPTSNEITGLKNGGAYQVFESGHIFWTPAQKAYAMYGPINTEWRKAGAENSGIGYPTSNQSQSADGTWTQTFDGGTFYSNTARGTWFEPTK